MRAQDRAKEACLAQTRRSPRRERPAGSAPWPSAHAQPRSGVLFQQQRPHQPSTSKGVKRKILESSQPFSHCSADGRPISRGVRQIAVCQDQNAREPHIYTQPTQGLYSKPIAQNNPSGSVRPDFQFAPLLPAHHFVVEAAGERLQGRWHDLKLLNTTNTLRPLLRLSNFYELAGFSSPLHFYSPAFGQMAHMHCHLRWSGAGV